MAPPRDEPPIRVTTDFVVLTSSLATRLLPTLHEIDADALGEPWRSEQWLVDLPEKWVHSRVATVDGRPVGFIVASRKAHAVHVHRIAVAASWRDRGIGAALLRAAAASARSRGAARLTLKVARSNARALHLYHTLGFTHERSEEDNACLIAPVATLLATGAARRL